MTAKPDEKPCGCRVRKQHSDVGLPHPLAPRGPEILYCPLHAAAGQMAEALEKALAALLLTGRVEVIRGEARYHTSGQCLIHQDQIRDCGTAVVEAEAALAAAGRGK